MTKTKNPYLEELGKYIPQGGNKFGGGNSLGTGINIAQQDFKNHSQARNQHDDDADLYGSIANDFSAQKNDLGALLGGFSEGLQHGAKRKSTAKKQEALDKYDRVMEYYRGVTEDANKRNEWYQKREFAQKKYLPQVLTYSQNADRLDSQSRVMWANNLMDGWNREMGTDYKVMSADANNYNLFTVKNNKGQIELLDLTNMMAGDETAQALMTAKMPEFMMKQEEMRKQKEFDNGQQERRTKALEKKSGVFSDGEKGGGQNETLTVGDHSYRVGSLSETEKTARSEYQKKVYKDIDAIPKNNQALEAIETMEEVFNRNPNIGTSLINMLDNPDGTDSWWNIFGRKLSGQDLTDMEILKKASNDLNLDTILGISGKAATDLLKKAVQAASPTGKLSKGGFDKNASVWKKKLTESNELAIAKYDAMQKGLSLVPNPRGSASAKPQNESSGGDNEFDLSNLGAKLVQ